MNKRLMQAMMAVAAMSLAGAATAQNFTTDVVINKPGTSGAKLVVGNGEGAVSMVANDNYLTLEVPNGSPRLVFRNGLFGVGVTAPVTKLHLFQGSTASCTFRMQNSDGFADFLANDGLFQVFVGNNPVALTLNASGNMTLAGQTSTSVLEIRGGSDLSENFDVNSDIAVIPGMVVSIDPENAGKLLVAHEAYDTKVAGVISGAGGLNTGMTMSQQGSELAHGDHPVALTGRVYCYVDADFAPVRPGDLLTTSTTPGHAMKAVDSAQASGATIGKAMTALESGKGLVLVLVNLH